MQSERYDRLGKERTEDMKENELVSVCIPCYNEEDNVRPVYEAVTREMEKLTKYDYEFVFRDNASTDESYERLKALAQEDKRVKIIENLANYGPGVAGATWGNYVSGDVVIFLACDLKSRRYFTLRQECNNIKGSRDLGVGL